MIFEPEDKALLLDALALELPQGFEVTTPRGWGRPVVKRKGAKAGDLCVDVDPLFRVRRCTWDPSGAPQPQEILLTPEPWLKKHATQVGRAVRAIREEIDTWST